MREQYDGGVGLVDELSMQGKVVRKRPKRKAGASPADRKADGASPGERPAGDGPGLKLHQADTADAGTADGDLRALAEAIKADLKAADESDLERLRRYHAAGQNLLKAKDLCGHGRWGEWLKDNFRLKPRRARQYMDFAERQFTADLAEMKRLFRHISGNGTKSAGTEAVPGADAGTDADTDRPGKADAGPRKAPNSPEAPSSSPKPSGKHDGERDRGRADDPPAEKMRAPRIAQVCIPWDKEPVAQAHVDQFARHFDIPVDPNDPAWTHFSPTVLRLLLDPAVLRLLLERHPGTDAEAPEDDG